MKRAGIISFALKAALFVAPVVILLLLDNLILPRGFFSFRAWEALVVKTYGAQLPGMFYPNQTMHRTETGDLGHGTKFAVPKEVTWVTDGQGRRNLPGHEYDAEILITGDSMTVGPSLDQEVTFPVQLEKATGLKATGVLVGDIRMTIRDMDRHFKRLPRVLIWQVIERSIPNLKPVVPEELEVLRYHAAPPREGWRDELFTRLDYLEKLSPIRSARSWLDRSVWTVVAEKVDPEIMREFLDSKVTTDRRMVTMLGSEINFPKSDQQVEECAQNIASHMEALRKRGVMFVFLPVPNKENVYWDQLPRPVEPTFLPRLVKRLRELGVPTVDLQQAFGTERARHPGELLYHLDDTHWNERGVSIAVRELEPLIERAPVQAERKKVPKKKKDGELLLKP